MKFESIFNDLIEFRKFPNYQLERRIDIFLLQFMPDLLRNHFNNASDWRLVLPEFPVQLNEENDRYDQMDYLFWNGETLLFVELKTDSKSYRKAQIDRYVDLTDSDWSSMYSFLIKKSRAKKNWRKFADQILYIQTNHPNLSLVDCKLETPKEVRDWRGSFNALPKMEIDYLFIGPESVNHNVLSKQRKLLTLKKCAEFIRNKTNEHETFCRLLEDCV